jgi:hypothetical protein
VSPAQIRRQAQLAITAGGGGKQVVLNGEETAMLREVLVACSQMMTWAQRHGGPATSDLLAAMTRSTASGRSPGGLLHDLNLAIDYLDFAPAARSPR